ncbi:hypothetical protein BTH42_18590 [Burkholderia sp. SRS-W-2-2016]|uniref:hypothetical protein n=1 Tax=Burkholderia sp. SRS-W-2-2016 TaxID=1926878 RepID=UPI00094AEEBF|nr:hypothetical protein [Burkholderia sp. SRS-W-2-2016]OLL30124.1 hypothetical protein BTH42_18590 [Burkholderia sp. SRS-W-2-2016]
MTEAEFDVVVGALIDRQLKSSRRAGLLTGTNAHTSAEATIDDWPWPVLHHRRELFDRCGGAAPFWQLLVRRLTATGFLDPAFPSQHIKLRLALCDAFGSDADPELMDDDEEKAARIALLAALNGDAPKGAKTTLKQRSAAKKASEARRNFTPEQRAGIIRDIERLLPQTHSVRSAAEIVARQLNASNSELRASLGVTCEGEIKPETIRRWVR